MKKMAITCITLVLAFMVSVPRCVSAEDLYDKMAVQLCTGADELTNKKVAILPFVYVDGRESMGGNIIAERLTTRIINLKKLEVIERSMLDKVMAELKLQVSGVIASDSAKELGKILGVEAIITGSLVAMQKGKIEVNARLIRTETAEAIVASNVVLEKDWLDETEKPEKPAPVQVYQAAPKRAPSRGPGKRYGFVDILFGFGSNKMNLEFKNIIQNVKSADIGITCPTCNSAGYDSIGYSGLATTGGNPFGLRVGFFGNGVLGGDIEFSYETVSIKAQTTNWELNGVPVGPGSAWLAEEYATVKTFIISGDLLLRVPTDKVDPYMGFGLGLSVNSIELPYVRGFTQSIGFSAPTEDVGFGFVLRIPIGVRVKVSDNISFWGEGRYQLNSFRFDRDIEFENDSVTIKGFKFMLGIGVLF